MVRACFRRGAGYRQSCYRAAGRGRPGSATGRRAAGSRSASSGTRAKEPKKNAGGGKQGQHSRCRETPAHPAADTGVSHPGSRCYAFRGGTQHVGRHHRRQHARHHQREEHGNRRRPAELDEKLPRHTAHEGSRQEDRDQGKSGSDHRQADLVGGFHRRLVGRLAFAQMAHDVLDLDDGVVDQDADHQRHRKQGHDIEREAHQVHHRRRWESPRAAAPWPKRR
jgi:hypothetical protein